MRGAIVKADWLTAQACPAMAWHRLRAKAVAPAEAEQFRMKQGQEIGALARRLYSVGVMVPPVPGKTPGQVTAELLDDTAKETFFEATVVAGSFVAKADILQRQQAAWHVLEVKSRFLDDLSQDLIDDLAYTVMVFQRAGLTVAKASFVLLSRNFRFGDDVERLFEVVERTSDVMRRAAEFDASAEAISKALLSNEPPEPVLVSACRECRFFDEKCLGAGIAHTVLEIPGLHQKKLNRLSSEGIIDLSCLPHDLELNRQQQRARDAILAGKPIIGRWLSEALAAIVWPCYYLDFATVATVLPLYAGHSCHQQVLTQFSLHRRNAMDAKLEHQEYLADATRDCQREVAEALINT